MTTPDTDPAFDSLLDYLKRTRGFDFTGYKRAGLARRFQKQMQLIGVDGYADYRDYLEVHTGEFSALFDAILINVTAFFRDPAAWDHLRVEVLPRLIASKSANEPIRIWSAGCASGEEAYTLAMAFAEALGVEQFRDRVKIYATDVDEEALTHARHASYGVREVAGVPEPLLDKYFERTDSRFVFQRDLRRSVIFGRNDLMQDAPISRVDLLVCRNTLMYLNSEVQARILSRFNFALNDDGFLFLGKAEMLFSHATLFQPLELKWRIFTKLPRRGQRDHIPLPIRANGADNAEVSLGRQVRIREVVFDAGSIAQVVVDLGGQIALVNEQARGLFRISSLDLGRPFQELELSYQPAELRSLIERVQADRRPASLKDVRWLTSKGEARFLDVLVVPLLDSLGNLLGVSITFADVTRFKQMQGELEVINRELETAYEELQSTNEELETTNEELQSSNEELETMNEELQSTNEELHTMNDEMRQRGVEMDQLNDVLASILASLSGGAAVVDPDLQVVLWSGKSEDLWGLRADEVIGKHFLNLDIGLPVDQLRPLVRACLAGESKVDQIVLDATNRRGKAIRCHVTCTPLYEKAGVVRGALLLAEEVD
ncbi:MAG: PAS domain-containing protein [Pseudomonadota bacterium]|nr:PAS domain-containing protein [Pseudomonadota bacterium]